MVIIKEKIKLNEAHNLTFLVDAVVKAVAKNGQTIQIEVWTNKLNQKIVGKLRNAKALISSGVIFIVDIFSVEVDDGNLNILNNSGNTIESHKIKSFSVDYACVMISCTDGAYLKIYNK